MKNPELFLSAINTMLYAWGGDTPSEAIWAMNDFITWINEEYNTDLLGVDEYDYESDAFDIKIEALKQFIEG